MKFERLNGAEASKIDPDGVQWPNDSIVVVAKNGDEKIKGRSAIIQLPHIEGTWVDESLRGTTLAFRLVAEVEKILKENSRTHAWAFIEESRPEVISYMERIGYKKMPFILMSREL